MTTAFSKLPLLSSRLFVPALLVGALLLPACSKSPAQIEKKDFSLGQHYLSEGKVNEAIIEFQNVLKVNPKSVKGRLGLATAYLKKGWTAESMLEFQEVAKEDPLNLDAHLALARYGVNSGQWNAVKPEITAVLKIDPSNVEGLSDAGERELALGHEKEAEASFKKALALSPGAVAALVGMGDLLRHENHPKQAADYYNRALSSDPKDARALTGLGSLAQSEAKPDEAKEDFRKAIDADRSDLRARIVYANFLAGSGHADQAIALLKAIPQKAADLRIPVKIAEYEVLLGQNVQAIALMHPLELQKILLPDIYLVLAKAYQNSGRLPEALEEATKLSTMDGVPPVMKIVAARVELAGRNPGKAQEILDSIKGVPNLPDSYWTTLAMTDLAENRSGRSVQIADKGLEAFPDDPQLLRVKSDALVQEKKLGEALKTVELLLSKDPQNPDFVGRKGILIARMKGVPSEVAYYQRISRKYPDNPTIETLYILSLSSSKKLFQAISESKEYLSSHPANNAMWILLSDFYLQSGQRDQALAVYKKVLANDPRNLQALTAYGYQELQLGHKSKAESLYRRALRVRPDDPNLETALGEALLSENQRDAAMVAFKKALESNPNQILALLELGRNEVLSGDARGAITHLAPLVKLPFSPGRRAQVLWLWGLANERAGNANVASDALEKAVRLEPKVAAYRESLGEYLASRSQWDKALPELEKGYALDPKNTLLSLQIAWAKVKNAKGAPEKSRLEKLVSKASLYRKSHPQDPTAGLIEARADLLLKKPDQALSVYDSILAAFPGNSSAQLGKANILLAQGHLRKSEKIADSLLSVHPDDLRVNLLMASIDQGKKDVKGMVDHLEKIHRLAPSWTDPALSLAAADLSLKRFEEAKSISFSLHEAHPELTGAYLIQASSEMGLGEYRSAEKDFVALARHSKNPGGLYNLASVAAGKAGEAGDAKKYIDEAFRYAPEDPGVLNNLAFSLADRKTELPKALSYAKKALDKVHQPYVQDTVGYVLYRMGRFDQAEPYFAEAYKANFRDPEFLLHMGLNEWKLGKKDDAESLLRKAETSGKLSPEEQGEAHRALAKL